MASSGFDLSALMGGGADSIDPAMLQMKPRMDLAKALTTAGMDTSAAHPMQALARVAQGAAGGYLQNRATSDLARLYAQQAGGMATALEQAAPGHPLITALTSDDPMTQAMALRQAGPALMKLPEEAESRRRFEVDQKRHEQELGLRRQQIELSKTPPGWVNAPDGGMDFKPRGPADPKYLAESTEARAKPREFSVDDVTKLSEEGGKFRIIGEFKNTFEPRFAGYKSEAIGNVATWTGRNVPSMASKDTVDAAQWWQGYDRFKNVVRNELFGAALTATEKAAFERADINAGMDPKTIEVNIARQYEIAQNGLKRKANALIQSGFDPKPISTAYGLKLEDIGVTGGPKRGGPAAGAGPVSPPATAQAAPAAPAATAPALAGAGPAASPAPPVPGAERARDGKWYVPNPDRPGKYLEVVQ